MICGICQAEVGPIPEGDFMCPADWELRQELERQIRIRLSMAHDELFGFLCEPIGDET